MNSSIQELEFGNQDLVIQSDLHTHFFLNAKLSTSGNSLKVLLLERHANSNNRLESRALAIFLKFRILNTLPMNFLDLMSNLLLVHCELRECNIPSSENQSELLPIIDSLHQEFYRNIEIISNLDEIRHLHVVNNSYAKAHLTVDEIRKKEDVLYVETYNIRNGLNILFDAVYKSSFIETITVYGGMNTSQYANLGFILENSNFIKEIRVYEGDLSITKLKLLTHSLSLNQSLEYLVIKYCRFNFDAEIEGIFLPLCFNSTLKGLTLGTQFISNWNRFIPEIVTVFKHSETLEKLDIGLEELDEKNLIEIFKSLRFNNSVRELSINMTNTNDKAFEELTHTLQENQGLRKLQLRYKNRLFGLFGSLLYNKTLQFLELYATTNRIHALSAGCNPHCSTCEFYHDMQKLEQALAYNSTLMSCIITTNHVGYQHNKMTQDRLNLNFRKYEFSQGGMTLKMLASKRFIEVGFNIPGEDTIPKELVDMLRSVRYAPTY